jgi:hypothetical protein
MINKSFEFWVYLSYCYDRSIYELGGLYAFMFLFN